MIWKKRYKEVLVMKLKKSMAVILTMALVLVMISPICAFASDPVVGVLTIFAFPVESSISLIDLGHA